MRFKVKDHGKTRTHGATNNMQHSLLLMVAPLAAVAAGKPVADAPFSCIKPVNPIPAGPPGACCDELDQSYLLKFLYTGKNCK